MPAAPALRLVLRARSKVSRAEPSLRSSLTEASGSPAVPQQPGEEGTVSMSITIVRDGASQQQVIDATTTGLDLFGDDRSIVAVRVNGDLRDLHLPLQHGDVVEPVRIDSSDGLNILRHSTAHVAAQAVQSRHRDAKLGIGPPIADGFYYDFDIAEPFTPEDLRELEQAMVTIVKERQRFRRRPVTDEQARAELAHEPYKLELIADKGSAPSPAEAHGDPDGSGDAAGVEVGAG